MDRELIKHIDGYWSLVGEKGYPICTFKIGDKVKVIDKPLNCDWERTSEGTVRNIIFGKTNTTIYIRKTYYMGADCRLSDIVSMEVIK